MPENGPPRVARWLLGRFLPFEIREFVLGDLDEEYQQRLSRGMPSRVRQWYWSQSLRSIVQARRRLRVADASRRHAHSLLGEVVSTIINDVRFAFRTFVRTPAFTLLTLLTLALGIGATTAIFSAVNEVVLRPLPFEDPDRLVMLWESNEDRGWQQTHAAPANVMDWRERVDAFEDVAMVNEYTTDMALSGLDQPIQIAIGQVSGNVFSVLGVPPVMGRTFTFEETWTSQSPRIVISFAAWQGYFGSDEDIVGNTIRLDGTAFEVIGVMGPEFKYSFSNAEMWMPFFWTEQRRNSIWFRQAHVVRAVARLAPGATIEQARQELTSVGKQLQSEFPETNRMMEAGLTPLQRFLVGDRRSTLLLLLGAVGILQLIACANVANLLLTRSATRRQEIAIRSALGAGRGRITRQVFTESLVLGVLGTMLGLALGVAGLRWISSLQPADLPGLAFRLDWRLVGFAVGLSGVSTVLFGILPATRSARLSVADQLTDGTRTGQIGRGGRLANNALVSLEIGLALVLVVGSGLMIRSVRELRQVDPGVNLTNVLTFEITPPSGTYTSDRMRADFMLDFIDAVRGIPGVVDAGGVRRLPYQGFGWTSDFAIRGWGPDQFGTELRHREATPGYFNVMGIPVLAGEMFDARLNPEAAVPVVVNRAFVERYFEDENPVGREIAFDRTPGDRSYWYRIVAVIGNERMSVTEDPAPEVIAHIHGDVPRTLRVTVKTTVPPLSIVPMVRETMAALNSEIPLVLVRTMEEVASEALATDRFLMTLLSVFALAALLLASIGVYGVSAQATRARTREIGIRLALGASGQSILQTLVTRGAATAMMGVALGLFGTVFAGRLLQGHLFGVSPTDPLTLGSVAILLCVIAIASTLGPAIRAAKLDPVEVLKAE